MSSHFKSLVIACVVTWSVGIGFGPSAKAMTLSEAMGYTFVNNANLNSQRAAFKASEENEAQAYAALYPTVSGTSSFGYDYSRTEPGSSTSGTSTSLGVSVTQRLYNGNRTHSGLNQVIAGVKAQGEELRALEQTTLLEGATAYMDVIRDTAIVELRESDVRFLEREVEAAMDRFSVGTGTQTDISQAEANLALAKSGLNQARAVLTASRAVFVQVIGVPPNDLNPSTDVTEKLPRSLAIALRLAETQHPSIRQADHGIEGAMNAIKVARGGLLPTLDLVGSYSRQYPVDNENMPVDYRDGASLTARLAVPIFKGGTEFSQIRQEREKLKQARLTADLVRQQVRTAVITSWGQYNASEATIAAYEAGVTAEQLALEGVIQEQTVGQRTTQDVLNQQRSLIDSRSSLIQAQRNRVVAAFTLLSSIGGLTSTTFELDLPANGNAENPESGNGETEE